MSTGGDVRTIWTWTGGEPLVFYIPTTCAGGAVSTRSSPGADSISWEGRLKTGVIRLPADFDPETDLIAMTVSSFRSLYTERSPITLESGGTLAAIVSDSCTNCTGATHHIGKVTTDKAVFRHQVRYTFGVHTFTVGEWTQTTKSVQRVVASGIESVSMTDPVHTKQLRADLEADLSDVSDVNAVLAFLLEEAFGG